MKNISKAIIVFVAIFMSACSAKDNSLKLSGTLEATEIDLYAQVGGTILEIYKEEGQAVAADEVIARVDSMDAELHVSQALANLELVQAQLDELNAGTRQEQIDQAKANLKRAKAQLEELKMGSRTEMVKQGEAQVKEAKAKLEEITAGNREEQIFGAQAKLNEAENNIRIAEQNYEYKKNNYDNILILRQAGTASKQEEDDAKNLLDTAVQLVNNANEQEKSARAQLALLSKGATSQSIAAATAQYEKTLANLELLKQGSTPQAIESGQATVDQCQAELDYLVNGNSQEKISQAEANVRIQEAALALAKNQLLKYEIKSPGDGVLLYKNADIGQVVNVGSIVATVQETDQYWIKVYVPQKYNGKILFNEKVQIAFSNLANQVVTGTVIFVSPKAEFTPRNIETTDAKQENTVFAVKVRLDETLDNINPGMNAKVMFNIDRP